MKVLENNGLDLKNISTSIIRNVFFYIFLGLFILYFTTLNPSSEGYINDVPNYFLLILLFILILYSIQLFYHIKSIHKSFKITIDGNQLIIEQKTEPKHAVIEMKKVKRIVQNKKGHLIFYKEGETVFDDSFAINLKAIKREEELIQYIASYQKVELEEHENKEEQRFRIRSIILQVIIAVILLFFFMTKSIYFIIPITFFIALVTFMGFQDKGKNMDIFIIFLFLFAMVKMGFAVRYIFM